MLATFRRRLANRLFDWQSRGVFSTPPLRLRPAPAAIVSMVRTEHLAMYLLSIKSFYRHIPGGDVIVLDDGSLTEADHAALREHVPGIRIEALSEIPTGPCPRGGCWERLLFILDESRARYVVQLDSDVLTSAPIPEVVAAIEGNRAFTLNSGPFFRMVTLEEASEAVRGHNMSYPQVAAEFHMPKLPAELGRRYIRGSAGFAGFARGAASRATAEAYSAGMEAAMGEQWRQWGTEQVASNFLVANSPGGEVLPWSRYACFGPEAEGAGASLLHFIGSWRFQGGVYTHRARQVIRDLQAA